MSGQELPYFKIVSALIDSGIWASLSNAARALYPVLLRFSDGRFKPVWPGTQRLLNLTGFKQKSSLRKARRELEICGLITFQTGTGRKNTYYQFRFDQFLSNGSQQRGIAATPYLSLSHPPGGIRAEPPGSGGERSGGASGNPPYNKIQISINNHVPAPPGTKEPGNPLVRRFGEKETKLAVSECELAGIEPTADNLKKILYRTREGGGESWTNAKKYLSGRISSGSLSRLETAFRGVEDGVLFFSEPLPEYLKELLMRTCERVFFEPEEQADLQIDETRRALWSSIADSKIEECGDTE